MSSNLLDHFYPNRDAIEYSKRVEPGDVVTFTGTDEVWLIISSELRRLMPDGRLFWEVTALSSWDDGRPVSHRRLEIDHHHWFLKKKEWK